MPQMVDVRGIMDENFANFSGNSGRMVDVRGGIQKIVALWPYMALYGLI